MSGDAKDLQARLKALLPLRWFADTSPNLDALLSGLATPLAWIYSQIRNVTQQARISTATGSWLDLVAKDFFGNSVARLEGEMDPSYRSRIKYRLFRPAATRKAVMDAVEYLTGHAPWIFEPAKSSDTGCYGAGSASPAGIVATAGYGIAGGWGSLSLPFQFFAIIDRPIISGLSSLPGYSVSAAGYGVGQCAYADLALLPGALSDLDILDFVREVLPVGVTAWVRIR
ncbi:hypothetical protein [Rhodopila sp.]|uniref:hypothetical protein n=1 Tax=Rhodopila sp. TaxID=2480087 RepID=UPI002C3A4ABC|nr:hypothetical protein [Rhodopila sp.]HVZ09320.1 hypothetical protein [Rhodopila sp.]